MYCTCYKLHYIKVFINTVSKVKDTRYKICIQDEKKSMSRKASKIIIFLIAHIIWITNKIFTHSHVWKLIIQMIDCNIKRHSIFNKFKEGMDDGMDHLYVHLEIWSYHLSLSRRSERRITRGREELLKKR